MQLLARLTTGFPFHPFLKQLLSKGNNSLLLLPHCKTEKNTAATLKAFREKNFIFYFLNHTKQNSVMAKLLPIKYTEPLFNNIKALCCQLGINETQISNKCQL